MENIPLYVESVSKSFGSRANQKLALNNVSISVNMGEIVGLLGQNGAGKSTLLKIVVGLLYPECGRVVLNGWESRNPLGRQDMGYVPEVVSMDGFLDTYDVMKTCGMLRGITGAVLEERIHILFSELNIPQVNQKLDTMSKGMLRRLAIAQSLISKPSLLILDEPTDGLDPRERRRFLQSLQKYRNEGNSVVVSSHVISEMESICDRVLFLNNGLISGQYQVQSPQPFVRVIISRESIPKYVLDKLSTSCKSIQFFSPSTVFTISNDESYSVDGILQASNIVYDDESMSEMEFQFRYSTGEYSVQDRD